MRYILTLSISISIFFSSVSIAKVYEGHKINDKITIDGKELYLNGIGVRTVKVLFIGIKVYLGSFYLEKKSKDFKKILSAPTIKHLSMKYLRDVDKDRLIKGWKKAFKTVGIEKKHKSSIDLFLSSLTEMKEKEVTSLTFYPDKGVLIENKGKKQKIIANKEFAKDLLGVWLRSDSDVSLRNGILGIKK